MMNCTITIIIMTPIYLCNESECWLTNKPKPYGITLHHSITSTRLVYCFKINNPNF